MMAPVSTSAAAEWAALWIAVGAFGWAGFLRLAAQLAYYNARRREERAAWVQLRREERIADRRWRRLVRECRDGPVSPSPIAISFHATDHLAAVERLLSRLPHSLREPS